MLLRLSAVYGLFLWRTFVDSTRVWWYPPIKDGVYPDQMNQSVFVPLARE